ncbi:MAG: hypothetical protein ACFFGZ_10035 [Candidatus Thorarchaeota archaeon]
MNSEIDALSSTVDGRELENKKIVAEVKPSILGLQNFGINSNLLRLPLQENPPILKRLYESYYELSAITDHLEAFKLPIIDVLELTPQENPRG